MGSGFTKWIWIVDLLVQLVRQLIDSLGNMNGGRDETAAVRRSAARVLDPDQPDEKVEVA